jgi:hypothetical protein
LILTKQESNKTNNLWGTQFCRGYKGFDFVHRILGSYWSQFSELPNVSQLNSIAQHYYHATDILSQHQVCFEPQQYEVPYEENIFRNKKVYTRPNSWHDFFNNITWLLWPKTKWAIADTILAQRSEQKGSNKNRVAKQSFLAQFDECGMLIVTAAPNLVHEILEHNWLGLFFNQRAQHALFEPIVFGHGLMEKAIDPYIGMTGKAMIIVVKPDYFNLCTITKLKFLDQVASQLISSKYCPQSPKSLQPFPLLGMPGWHPNNEQEKFFEQKHYFRAKRNNVPECAVLNQLGDKNLWGQWKWLAPCDLLLE